MHINIYCICIIIRNINEKVLLNANDSLHSVHLFLNSFSSALILVNHFREQKLHFLLVSLLYEFQSSHFSHFIFKEEIESSIGLFAGCLTALWSKYTYRKNKVKLNKTINFPQYGYIHKNVALSWCRCHCIWNQPSFFFYHFH